MKEFVIDLKNIIRNFQLGSQTVHVLKDIDLTIKKGEYVALMGPSDSGKSTLMNLLQIHSMERMILPHLMNYF